MITRRQLRAARALAGMGVRDLSRASGLSPTSISQIETGKTGSARRTTMRDLQRALEHRGVEFGPNGWVRHRDDAGMPIPEHGRKQKSARTGPGPHNLVHTMEQAIHERYRVCLHYLSADNETIEIEADPYTVHYVNDHLYLVGWNHTRGALDSFLLSRIRALTLLSQRFDRAAQFRVRRAVLTRLLPRLPRHPGPTATASAHGPKAMAKSIGSVCKRKRTTAELTQDRVAKAIGVSKDFYARIERGASLPSLPTLMRLASALHVHVDALLGLSPLSPGNARKNHLHDMDREPEASLDELGRLLQNASPRTIALVSRLLDILAPAGDTADGTAEAGDTADPG